MSFIAAAVIAGGASLAGGGLSLFGSLSASQQQKNAEQQALQQQEAMFTTAQNALSPYYTSGSQFGSTLSSLLTPGPNQTTALSQIPGFQFVQDWGQKAVQNTGTTLGLGGNTLTAGANFATGLAQQGLGSIVNPLVSLYGTGANAASALGGIAGNFSGQIGSTLTGQGQAGAAGTLGATNALGGALTGGANSYTNSLLLSKLFPGGGNEAYGGDASGIYGGSSAAPLPGLTADDYGPGF